MKRLSLQMLTLFCSAFLLAACSTTPSQNDDAMDDDSAMNEMNDDNSSMDDSDDSMTDDADTEGTTVVMSNFKFSEETLEARPGETLTILLQNDGGTHDFVIDELDVQSKTLQTGQSETLTIEIPEDAAGEEYEFYCSIGQHRAMGMVGTLKISAN